jgi:hypothetical protein
MSGWPTCLDDTLAPGNWTSWNGSLVSRAASTGNAAGHRAQYVLDGNIQCAVCKGFSYVLWGRTTCATGDSAIYVGHIANIAFSGACFFCGSWDNAGPVCVDDAASADAGGVVTWTDWTTYGQLVRAAGASPDGGVEGGPAFSQYLDGKDGPCVVCR